MRSTPPWQHRPSNTPAPTGDGDGSENKPADSMGEQDGQQREAYALRSPPTHALTETKSNGRIPAPVGRWATDLAAIVMIALSNEPTATTLSVSCASPVRPSRPANRRAAAAGPKIQGYTIPEAHPRRVLLSRCRAFTVATTNRNYAANPNLGCPTHDGVATAVATKATKQREALAGESHLTPTSIDCSRQNDSRWPHGCHCSQWFDARQAAHNDPTAVRLRLRTHLPCRIRGRHQAVHRRYPGRRHPHSIASCVECAGAFTNSGC